ncbi:phage holin family protein [Kineosporia babensis]|uniref:Phage holin family protein n=1 Tax=Kineosporia babensis TaxID=499548 RepID=A0A9X1SUH4_9ACTN|nr:phage holin family protein [Kineosporia babensis]MCD5312894.1 phage holin family protein [Kineosporia babensis]
MSVTHEKPGPVPAGHEKSTPELVQDLTRLVPQLARQEVELAKAELAEKAKHAGIGAGAFGGAGLVALFGVGTLVAAAVLGLAEAVPAWAAALIVAAVLLLVAGAMALLGRSQIRQATPPVPRQAVDSTKHDVEAVKESAHR